MAPAEEEIERLRRELADARRGLRVLHQEIGDQAESLAQLTATGPRGNVSLHHELRTPINTILSLSRFLAEEADGPLSPEQQKQVGFIRRAAETLSSLVDSVARSQATTARAALRLRKFTAADAFSALRGMIEPMKAHEGVTLTLDEPAGLPAFETDESKLLQVLRQLIGNALHFTHEGSVRLSVDVTGYGAARFAVADTGIGISRADLPRVFQEFAAIGARPGPGRGAGLAAARRLATQLGGELLAASEEGRGSTFTLVIPLVHPDAEEMRLLESRAATPAPGRLPVLVVDDDPATVVIYDRYLSRAGYQIVPARTLDEARERLAKVRPAAVVLDVMLGDESTWGLLSEVKGNPATRDIPVIVLSVLAGEDRARSLGADDFLLKPVDEQWLSSRLAAFSKRGKVRRVLLIDDDEPSRYLVRRQFAGTQYSLLEAIDCASGLRAVRAEKPDVVLLDFFLPDGTAIEVLDELKGDPRTRDIPVIVLSAQELSEQDRARLRHATHAVLAKSRLSRAEAIAHIRDALNRGAN